jgi:uncharacterized protein (TIGR03118 family)
MTTTRNRTLLARAAAALLALAAAWQPAHAAGVTQTNLTSDGSVPASVTDPHLVNAWGMSFAPGGPWWLSDNGTGLTTLYSGVGAIAPLVVTIPPPAGQTGHSSPTGQVYNNTAAFVATKAGKSGPSLFLFATEDGTISGWSPSVDLTNAVTLIDNSASHAIYKGLALATSNGKPMLLATNFHAGVVEVYDGSLNLVTSFRDAGLQHVFAPFNVAVLDGKIYVSYARQRFNRKDDWAAPGNGMVEQVDITGKVLRRVQVRGPLNSPWGMALAPSTWGAYAGALLVGNFGDGRVTAFNLTTRKLLGQLTTPAGVPIAIPGLWGLTVGNGGLAGPTDSLFFTAGPGGESGGLFGSLTFAP